MSLIKNYTIIKDVKKEIHNQHVLSVLQKSFYDLQATSIQLEITLISWNIPLIQYIRMSFCSIEIKIIVYDKIHN